MKSYSEDLRIRMASSVEDGDSVAEVAATFRVSVSTVRRCFNLYKAGESVAPKTSWGTWRKLNPSRLADHVDAHPDATLKEIAAAFDVSVNCVWQALKKLNITLKKSTPSKRTPPSHARSLLQTPRKARKINPDLLH